MNLYFSKYIKTLSFEVRYLKFNNNFIKKTFKTMEAEKKKGRINN